ncbi:MAG: PaaX family transcriptional regulator C-terminal domain-containing protein [Actinomycetota bacterium]
MLTVLGELVLPAGGQVWTGTVVASLGALGFGEGNARQAVARLADDGIVESARLGRRTRWALTPSGSALLSEGTDRIYRFATQELVWDGRWLVVVCPVAEDERAKRARLRSRLGFLGFGFLHAGLAVSPHPEREGLVEDVLRDLDVADAVVWRSELGGSTAADEVVRRAWDVAELDAAYRTLLTDLGDGGPVGDREAFVRLVRAVHAWRRFPSIDPELPAELLAADWPGSEAKRRFDERRSAWLEPARAWFAAVEAGFDDPAASPDEFDNLSTDRP